MPQAEGTASAKALRWECACGVKEEKGGPEAEWGDQAGGLQGPMVRVWVGTVDFIVCRAKPRRQVSGGSAVRSPLGLGAAPSMPRIFTGQAGQDEP